MVKSSIHVLFLNKNWIKLTQKLQNQKKREKYREELETVLDNQDNTIERYPIHVACMSGITKHALKAILRVSPDAAKMVDDEGSTPLHYMIHYDDRSKIDVLKVLLDAYPDALGIQDKYGCTPMFHAVDYAVGVEIEKMALLLNHDAAIKALTVTCQSAEVRKDRRVRKGSLIHRQESRGFLNIMRNQQAYDSGSVELYNTAPIYKIWDLALLRLSTVRFSVPINPNREQLQQAGKRLQKAVLMLEALYLEKPLDYERVRSSMKEKLKRLKNRKKSEIFPDVEVENILEAALRSRLRKIGKHESHSRLFEVELGANKFRVLHAVLTYHSYLPDVAYDYAIVHYSNQVNEKEEKTGNLPLHIACKMNDNSAFCRHSVLKELLDLYPDAAKIKNCRGQLPLHIALSADDQWSLESINELLKANPLCYEEVDIASKLYPFQLAAVEKKKSKCDQLSSIYTLLRKSPSSIL